MGTLRSPCLEAEQKGVARSLRRGCLRGLPFWKVYSQWSQVSGRECLWWCSGKESD